MTTIEITHHYDDVLQQILAEVKGLREDLKPKQASVMYDIRAESTKDAFVRAQRKERERVMVGGYQSPDVSRLVSEGLSDLLFKIGNPSLKGADRADDRGDEGGGADRSLAELLLADLYDLVQKFGGDRLVGRDVEGGSELGGSPRGSVVVDEVHDSSPSSGCGEPTVGDGGGPGGRIEQPGPSATLDRFLDTLGVKPAPLEECAEMFLRGEDVGQVFGLDQVTYLRMSYGLAGEFQLAPYQAGLLIDALATALRGAR